MMQSEAEMFEGVKMLAVPFTLLVGLLPPLLLLV